MNADVTTDDSEDYSVSSVLTLMRMIYLQSTEMLFVMVLFSLILMHTVV